MNPLLIVGGLGAAALLLLSKKGGSSGSSSGLNVTIGPSGKKWLVELVGRSGVEGSYLVYEPANPPLHGQYPVVQFSQLGDSPLRKVVARFPSVPKDIYKQALKDFYLTETF